MPLLGLRKVHDELCSRGRPFHGRRAPRVEAPHSIVGRRSAPLLLRGEVGLS
jgi:hypothetical protein